jgi:thiamine biosynthesis lipoprotein
LKYNDQRRTRRNFLFAASSLLPILVLPAGLRAAYTDRQYVHRTIHAMGTLVSVQAYGDDRAILNTAITKTFNDVRRMDSLLSVYDPQSEISRINARAGRESVVVSDETMDVVRSAVHLSKKSNAVFDCTVEPLMRLWGFRNPFSTVSQQPTDTELTLTMDAIGIHNISIDRSGGTIGLLNTKSAIDLGGIAVGYSVDRMAAILRAEGIDSALINHGGDIVAIGAPPETDGWEIGIPSPHDGNTIVHSLTLKDRAISTSGSTEKFRLINGKKYCHIIDTSNGTASDRQTSVSVITQSSMIADVFSTALFLSEQRMPSNDDSGTKSEYILIDSNDTIRSNFIFL